MNNSIHSMTLHYGWLPVDMMSEESGFDPTDLDVLVVVGIIPSLAVKYSAGKRYLDSTLADVLKLAHRLVEYETPLLEALELGIVAGIKGVQSRVEYLQEDSGNHHDRTEMEMCEDHLKMLEAFKWAVDQHTLDYMRQFKVS